MAQERHTEDTERTQGRHTEDTKRTQGNRFRALGRPASAPPGSMCCICECEFNEDAELSGKARGALVKKVLSLRTDPDIFASAMSKLPLAVRSIIEQRAKR